MGRLTEIYVAVKDKDYVLEKIHGLCDKYHNKSVPDYKQQRALFRNYCHDTLVVFNDCFETSMLGMIRLIRKVESFQRQDRINIEIAALEISNLLIELNSLVVSMVAIKDLPSCKHLIGLSAEDIIEKSKDLVKNGIVKAGIAAVLLGSKINNVVNIENIRNYYQSNLEELKNEIQIKAKPISPIEQFLIDKFNAEIGYCNTALLKAGIGITKELIDLVNIGKKHIEKYEKSSLIGNGNLVLSQI
ncbi:MAG: hypothetical protein IJ160_02340 [Muribaculaceae bacterium]|nr:hypothetical protein [Muribaculaceae bacterium]